MGINIKYKSLTFDPNVFTRGEEVAATITYTAIVDADDDNPVKFTLEVPSDCPIYFVLPDGSKRKKLPWEDNVSVNSSGDYTKEITVGVKAASGPITSVMAKITGKTKTNATSDDSRVIKHKN